MSLKEQLDLGNIPTHIAIIMDGNGRWAKKQGNSRIFGHKHGVNSVREVTEASSILGVKFLTLYTFSAENWSRPKLEVDALMALLVNTISNETKTFQSNNVKLNVIGSTDKLPSVVLKQLNKSIEATSNNTGLTLTLALSYSSRLEILDAVKKIATDAIDNKISPNDITAELFSSYLNTAGIPDPELLIRTSGEYRISNFLLWQIAYTELCFTDILWPDFKKEDFYAVLADYQKRERRFGLASEQLKK